MPHPRLHLAHYFNLRRDARPLATPPNVTQLLADGLISISDEMPGPWRLHHAGLLVIHASYFNLRRDARPLATRAGREPRFEAVEFQSQTRCQAPGDSILHP